MNYILWASERLSKSGTDQFSLEDLIIASWKESPNRFGLAGFETYYPDSNRVLVRLLGNRGLINRGFLAKVEPNIYTLTDHGKRRLKEDRLVTLKRMSAVLDDLKVKPQTFQLACRFWGLRTNWSQLDEILESCTNVLESSLSDCSLMPQETISELARLHYHFLNKYKANCAALRGTKDESETLYC